MLDCEITSWLWLLSPGAVLHLFAESHRIQALWPPSAAV
jgi:hypothetical protein